MTIPFVDTQMLSALEFLHYCKRFENTLFAFCFRNAPQCATVLMDLRVLMAARIRQVIFTAADPSLKSTLDSWNRAGDRFSVIEATIAKLKDPSFLERIRQELAAGNAAFIVVEDLPGGGDERRVAQAEIIACSVALGAEKIFFPGGEPGLKVNGKCRSYPSVQEVRETLASGAEINIPAERLQFLIEQQELHDVDIVLVEARRGAVYEEVFTHAGSGTLFTREYPNVLRAATEKDVRDIMALMQPYITEGSLKAMTEEDLLAMIRSFMVYSVNDQIIAAAALIEYGDAYELGKLCTLPRFQARGRARALVRALLDKARQDGKKSVFALTVQPYVGEFFERIGFKSVERESLPESWRSGYDFSRPSRAYSYSLT